MRPIQNTTNNEILVLRALQSVQDKFANEILGIHDFTNLQAFIDRIKSYQSLLCFNTTNIQLIIHYAERMNIKPTYLMTCEDWRGLGRYVQRGSVGLPILIKADRDHLKVAYVFDQSQCQGRELYDFSTEKMSTGTVYNALTTISEELGIEFMDIQDCDNVLTYVLDEVVFALVSKENTKLSELQLFILSELVSAILADTYNIPYTINDFTFKKDFTRDILARSIPVIFEVLRDVVTVFNNISLY